MSVIVILSILYGIIVLTEEKKWEDYKWTDLVNSGN